MLINKFKLLISPTIEPGNFGGKTDNPFYLPCINLTGPRKTKTILSNLKVVLDLIKHCIHLGPVHRSWNKPVV